MHILRFAFILVVPRLVRKLVSSHRSKIVLCEYNDECILPEVCCQSLFIDRCCVPERLILSPIPLPPRR